MCSSDLESVTTSAVDMNWPELKNPQKIIYMRGVSFLYTYTNEIVHIGARDSITIPVDGLFSFPHNGKLCENSMFIMKVTYKLPIIGIEKTDASVFESGQDAAGNPIWIKKPMTKHYLHWADISVVHIPEPKIY